MTMAQLHCRGVDRRKTLLTDRHILLMRLVWEGKADKEIATAMEIGPGSVKQYLVRLREKLGHLPNRTAVALEYERRFSAKS